ncbi:Holliday junction ATP-dependent DNA helicase RuvA [Paenibacillus baekrokdamisoli]|uniref:Holliday junction branch migration complex subunit RuvA n=1 Tax=Paenibacillus baekrokdamisoli TaxID=1712516 RepID=A0A3G9ILR4_9BACL|nr:Holliday junction branch migration protein RuvA [Paenibacillus baekrokdamisoli]MBB3067539.1 Holliday junction DNA helicase RuvA [Paenibacillus baekrokdamisoli]BBH19276.1 Holliday junction ATP-dependent DNA helicase RuvA [Paenibacillus baekrokdamisoli]
MIDFVRGRVVHWDTEYVVVDVRDIGYRLFTPNPYTFVKNDDTVTIYTHHHVREDAVLLFGFATREEQAMFRKLLEVSGIGPRVALGILAGGKPETIAAAIQQENIVFLTKLPGIGKKTAQRMILDLKDKLDAIPGGFSFAAAGLELEGAFGGSSDGLQGGEDWREAREALAALGYTAAELDRAWQALKDAPVLNESVDALMKRALQQLFKG